MRFYFREKTLSLIPLCFQCFHLLSFHLDCGNSYFYDCECHNFDHFKKSQILVGFSGNNLELIPGRHWSKCAYLCEKAYGSDCKAFHITEEGQCMRVTSDESCAITGSEITVYSRTNMKFVGKLRNSFQSSTLKRML